MNLRSIVPPLRRATTALVGAETGHAQAVAITQACDIVGTGCATAGHARWTGTRPGIVRGERNSLERLHEGGDVIDALAVSDVDGQNSPNPDGVWNTDDEILFSLAAGSPSLTNMGNTCTAANPGNLRRRQT